MSIFVRISELPAAIAAATGNLLAAVQSGVTRQITFSALADWIVQSSLSFLSAGSGSVAESLSGYLNRATVHATSFMTEAQRADVTSFTGSLNVAAALQAAEDYASSIGATIYYAPGKYNIGTTTLQLKRFVIHQGSGRDVSQSGLRGTYILYSGTSDALQYAGTVDVVAAVSIHIRDLTVVCSTRTAGKAAVAFLAAAFVHIDNVAVAGNDYGIILDQVQHAKITDSDIELTHASSTAGIWLVNGAERTVGADAFLTNHIQIENNQIGGNTAGVGIADDGGASHIFRSNNFNGCNKHIRVNSALGLTIEGENQMELPATTCIEFATTKLGGAAGGKSYNVEIDSNFLYSSAAINLITFGAASIEDLIHTNNHYNNANAGGAPFTGLSTGFVTSYTGFGNKQVGIGSTSVGNSLTPKTTYTPTFTSSNADAVLGNGTITGSYVRQGGSITATVNFTVGTTTTLGTGQWRFGLPFASSDTNAVVGAWYGSPAGTFRTGGVAVVGNSFCTIVENAVGFLGGTSYAWANGNVVNLTITYPIAQSN